MARPATIAATARAWLPDAAIRAVDIDGVLDEVARNWSGKWFAKPVRRLDRLGPAPLHVPVNGEWLSLDHDVAVAVPDTARAALFGMMLDLDVPDQPRSPIDERLLREVTQTCLDDLCRHIAELFRLDASTRWTQAAGGTSPGLALPLTCTLGIDARTPLLRIAVANDALVGLARVGLPPLVKQKRLSPLSDGLAAQDIALSAHIGRCSLTLADLADLGVGDVLVFEHTLGAPLDLFVNRAGTPVARCSIAQNDTRLDLTLLDTIGTM